MLKFLPIIVILTAITSSSSYRLEDGSEPASISDGQMNADERQFPDSTSATEVRPLDQESTPGTSSDLSSTASDESTTSEPSSATSETTAVTGDMSSSVADNMSESTGPSSGHEVEMTHSSTAKPSGIDDEEPKPDNLTEILGAMSNDSDTVVSEITDPSGANNQVLTQTDSKKCDKNMEYVTNPDDCRTYYKCVGEEAILMNCPSGLYWTPSDNSCTTDGFLTCGLHDNSGSSSNTLSTETASKPQMGPQKQFLDACHQICMTNSKLKGEQDITNQPDYELSYYVCKCMNHAHPTA